MTSVAVLGAGKVGQALATRLVAAGIDVRFGVRDPLAAGLSGELAAVPLTTPNDAASTADIVLLAVPAAAAIAAARSAGDLAGRVVVDCTNPLRWDRGPVWTPPSEGSVTAALAAALPTVAVVKGFNHFGAEIQLDPSLAGGPADAFFASDDDAAKASVMELATRMGFRAHDAGPLRNAAALENLAVLWIHLAGAGAGREWAFRMEGREPAEGS
ncbi:MAG: NAD(P)-binding domain-containing protein [Acidobacteria bacterium]|nr:NAD(P)-binding domain-containing protein [Acidobacteriota bacterium]